MWRFLKRVRRGWSRVFLDATTSTRSHMEVDIEHEFPCRVVYRLAPV